MCSVMAIPRGWCLSPSYFWLWFKCWLWREGAHRGVNIFQSRDSTSTYLAWKEVDSFSPFWRALSVRTESTQHNASYLKKSFLSESRVWTISALSSISAFFPVKAQLSHQHNLSNCIALFTLINGSKTPSFKIREHAPFDTVSVMT